MGSFTISMITEKGIDSVAGMLAPEIVSAVKKGLPATALAVVEDDTAIGALGGAIDRDTFEIVSIYVTPEHRRRGAGTALMKELFELADAEDLMVRAEYTPVDSDGRTLEPFFKAMDFLQEDLALPVYYVDELRNFTLDSRSLPGSRSEILTFEETPAKVLNEAMAQRDENEGLLAEMDDYIDHIEKDMSFAAVDRGEIKSCVLTERVGSRMIQLSPVWSAEGDIRDVRLMLSFVLDEIRKNFSPDTRIITPALDNMIREIVDEVYGTSVAVTLSFFKTNFASLVYK